MAAFGQQLVYSSKAIRSLVLTVSLGAGIASDLTLPGFLFHATDPVVGNVENVSDDVLSQRIRGKTALIIGGTDGIGRGTALAMARRGVSVTVVGHSPTKAACVVGNMSAIAKYPKQQHFRSYAVDLFTVKGQLGFTETVTASGAMFDYLVLTVGIWPDAKNPKTSDGVNKVLALDVLARFLTTRELITSLKPGARVMSILASTMAVPPLPRLPVIKEIALGKRKASLSRMLGTAGALGDTWMQKMVAHSKVPNISFIGTFPGVIADDLVAHSGTFPKWLRPILDWSVNVIGMKPEECGRLHTAIISSPNVARRPVSYFNINLEGRYTSPVAYDLGFQEWVWNFLEETVTNHTVSPVRQAALIV